MITNFSAIAFDPATHSYTLNGRHLTAVTSIISQLKPPFDREYWSQRKAGERGVSVEVILKEWDDKSKASMEKGRQVHAHIEKVLRGEVQSIDDPFLSLNQLLPEINAFNRLWQRISEQVSVHEIEWIVGDDDFGVAGTLDALFSSKQTETFHIWDWKTGSKFNTHNRFQTLLPPFDDLDDCELNVYSLQISLYYLILERNVMTPSCIGDGYIVHLTPEGISQIHKALDLRKRLEQWILEQS